MSEVLAQRCDRCGRMVGAGSPNPCERCRAANAGKNNTRTPAELKAALNEAAVEKHDRAKELYLRLSRLRPRKDDEPVIRLLLTRGEISLILPALQERYDI